MASGGDICEGACFRSVVPIALAMMSRGRAAELCSIGQKTHGIKPVVRGTT